MAPYFILLIPNTLSLTIILRARVGYELAITTLISNKREWNNCFIKFLKLQKFEVRNTSVKNEKIRAKSKKNLMKMQCCVTPCGHTHHKKHFLPFRVLLNVGLDTNFPQKIFFFFFGFIQRKISLSCENIFSLATLRAIIYHIRSN